MIFQEEVQRNVLIIILIIRLTMLRHKQAKSIGFENTSIPRMVKNKNTKLKMKLNVAHLFDRYMTDWYKGIKIIRYIMVLFTHLFYSNLINQLDRSVYLMGIYVNILV